MVYFRKVLLYTLTIYMYIALDFHFIATYVSDCAYVFVYIYQAIYVLVNLVFGLTYL